jgi:hypothetical protein
MTSTELEVVIKDCDAAWHGPDGMPMMNPSEPTDVATYRATLEVAYQLALLNENLGTVIGNRNPQIRVMVEPGDWPIQTQEYKL